MPPNESLSGRWHSTYWWPSNQNPGTEEPSEYDVIAEQTGKQLIMQSIPNNTQSYLLLRLIVEGDGIYVSGSWTENTSPTGEFAGMIYSGLVQLLISKDRQSMSGKWVGIGQDLERDEPDVYDGRWELQRLDPA